VVATVTAGTVVEVGAVVAAGAVVEAGAVVAAGAVVEAGAVVVAGAVVEAGPVVAVGAVVEEITFSAVTGAITSPVVKIKSNFLSRGWGENKARLSDKGTAPLEKAVAVSSRRKKLTVYNGTPPTAAPVSGAPLVQKRSDGQGVRAPAGCSPTERVPPPVEKL
jgi:carbonic anhydrase/acetyltransferase-like protein (isoleucine patch superfamily)